jgi:cytosine/adenosine deaminase-related metal-dependent hydrolase
VVIEGCAVVTVDAAGTRYDDGHVVVRDGVIAAVGPGRAPAVTTDAGVAAAESMRRVDGSSCVLTPGLVNVHHHLYQWATRGLAVDATLFDWLTTLYPVWGGIDEDIVRTASVGALGWLARTGCTTTTDHHYVFPTSGGDVLGATVDAAQTIGLRFHPTRGSMDLGQSQGGLPPDHMVEDIETILDASVDAIKRFHDTTPEAMVRVALAPCSPFSVTTALLRETAALAREYDVRLHTHLCETEDEEDYCTAHFGMRPLEYAESVGWLGPDVWFAHAVHLSDHDIATMAATGTAAAHCPSSNGRLGSGIARTRDLRRAGVTVGLGVDGVASNEAGSLLEEVRHALLFARARSGPDALTVMDALEMATMSGARVIGRQDDIGSIEVGKQADLALWRLDTMAHQDIDDPVAALVLGSPPPLELLLVQGRPVVERDRLVAVDETDVARSVRTAHDTLLSRAERSA